MGGGDCRPLKISQKGEEKDEYVKGKIKKNGK